MSNEKQQTQAEPLTEHTIQRRLNKFFASWKYNVDGLYVFGWESDKLIWTKAGYIYEFEIKISRSDFKNDFKHKKNKHVILQGPTAEEEMMPDFYRNYELNKHLYASIDECKARTTRPSSYYIADHKKPNFFYYTVPEGMIQPDEVPEYAGLVYVPEGTGSLRIVKKAPQLHKEKYKDAQLNLCEKFYYNWQTDRRLRLDAERDLNGVRELLKEELEQKGQEMTYKQMEQRLNTAIEECNYWKEQYNRIVRENIANNAERKRLRKAILQLSPDFDFTPIEDEVNRIYGLTKR